MKSPFPHDLAYPAFASDPTIPHSAEYVCLVDDDNREIGICEKRLVHGPVTPLHRAFSIFLFREGGQFLAQQRAFSKLTWPGIWSNTCCGHPAPGEELETAARRRLWQELQLQGGSLHLALPDFRYRASFHGVEENEICPVFVGRMASDAVSVDPREIAALDWVDWPTFRAHAIASSSKESGTGNPYQDFSPWSKWEARLLCQSEAQWRPIVDNLPAFSATAWEGCFPVR